MTTRRWGPAIERMRRCEGKVQHKNQASADQQALRLNRRNRAMNCEAYACPYCGNWHVGHARPKE